MLLITLSFAFATRTVIVLVEKSVKNLNFWGFYEFPQEKLMKIGVLCNDNFALKDNMSICHPIGLRMRTIKPGKPWKLVCFLGFYEFSQGKLMKILVLERVVSYLSRWRVFGYLFMGNDPVMLILSTFWKDAKYARGTTDRKSALNHFDVKSKQMTLKC